MRRETLAVLLLGYLWLAAPSSVAGSTFEFEELDALNPIHREVRFGLTVLNPKNRRVETARLWVQAPALRTWSQQCRKIVTSHPATRLADKYGNQVLLFTFKDLPPRGREVVTIRAELRMAAAPGEHPAPGADAFLFSSVGVESDHLEMLQLAKRLRDTDPTATALNVFRWVAGNTARAGYLKSNRGALYALRQRRGDCTEFAHLFVALCRAAGVPARTIAGYVIAEDGWLSAGDYHNWTEFHDGSTWQVVDPEAGRFKDRPSRYLVTEVNGGGPGHPLGEGYRFRSEPAELDVRWD